MPKKRTIYRDKDTGRFVSKSTWKRSRAHGGKRYTRLSYRKRPKRKAIREIPAMRPAALPEDVFEWIVTGWASKRYQGKRGHQLNIIATGRTPQEAGEASRDLLRQFRTTRGLADSAVFTRVVKANRTDEEPGQAEWRNK